MKKFTPSKILILAAVTSVVLCSCSDPQKVARKSLEAKGYEATTRDLIVAAGAGDSESLALFQEAGIGIDSTDAAGNTALIKAASAGRLDTVEKILGLGADPRHANSLGRDALISSAAMGYAEVGRMLIGRGADATAKDSEGWTALSIAAYNGHSEVVSMLSAQAAPEELDDALLVASFSGDAEVVSKLLSQGANINARSPESKTPLMIAADGGKLEAVRVLLQNQANPYAEDGQGKTAANLAELAGHAEVMDLILTPDQWGTTPESLEVLEEMAKAQEALVAESSVEETLVDTAGETIGAEPVEAAAEHSNESPAPAAVSEDQRVVAANSSAKPGKVVNSGQIREQAKSKPIVALNGSTIHSRSPKSAPVKTMVLSSFHEEPLPIAVEKVDGNRAEIRRLDQSNASPVEVEPGAVIPGTPYEVKEVTRKFVSSKEGKGRMVDVSRVKVENRVNGATHLLVQDVAGQSSDTYAILTSPNSQYRYVVKRGDVFRTSQPDKGVKDYQVLDIRASGVVLKDLSNEEVLTIARNGLVSP